MDLPLHQVIQAPALFYKTIAMKGRDDQWRVYPTFVTSNVFITSSANQQLVPTAFLAVVLFGFVAFVWYWIIRMTRRKRLLQPRGRIHTHDVLRAAQPSPGLGLRPEQPDHVRVGGRGDAGGGDEGV